MNSEEIQNYLTPLLGERLSWTNASRAPASCPVAALLMLLSPWAAKLVKARAAWYIPGGQLINLQQSHMQTCAGRERDRDRERESNGISLRKTIMTDKITEPFETWNQISITTMTANINFKMLPPPHSTQARHKSIANSQKKSKYRKTWLYL